MLRIPTIILGLLSLCHFCLAMDPNGPGQGRQEKEEPELKIQVQEEIVTRAPPKQRLVTVDAAMSIDAGGAKYLYLFIGKEVQVLKNRDFLSDRARGRFIPDDMNLQAVFVTLENQNKRVFFGDRYGHFKKSMNSEGRKLKYGPARKFLRNGGPDAAGRLDGTVYVFKGCQVAIRKKWDNWGKPTDITEMGLPCDVDAAWKEDDEMVILKGDMVWRWKKNGKVEGPEPFGSKYKLKPGYALMSLRE